MSATKKTSKKRALDEDSDVPKRKDVLRDMLSEYAVKPSATPRKGKPRCNNAWEAYEHCNEQANKIVREAAKARKENMSISDQIAETSEKYEKAAEKKNFGTADKHLDKLRKLAGQVEDEHSVPPRVREQVLETADPDLFSKFDLGAAAKMVVRDMCGNSGRDDQTRKKLLADLLDALMVGEEKSDGKAEAE